eukprot:17546-Heterococcus_DN1.PRE.3
MVRNVVGAMLAVSCGTLAVRDIEGVFADGLWAGGEKHKTAAMPAPAHGLTLERVFYGDETEELLGTVNAYTVTLSNVCSVVSSNTDAFDQHSVPVYDGHAGCVSVSSDGSKVAIAAVADTAAAVRHRECTHCTDVSSDYDSVAVTVRCSSEASSSSNNTKNRYRNQQSSLLVRQYNNLRKYDFFKLCLVTSACAGDGSTVSSAAAAEAELKLNMHFMRASLLETAAGCLASAVATAFRMLLPPCGMI